MKTITKSVIKLSELPKHLQESEVFNEHKTHTYAEFHIDDSEKDELTLWLIEKYPTIKMKVSFLIHIDIEKQQQGYSEEDMKSAFKVGFSIGYGSDVHAIDEKNRTCEEWFEQFKKK